MLDWGFSFPTEDEISRELRCPGHRCSRPGPGLCRKERRAGASAIPSIAGTEAKPGFSDYLLGHPGAPEQSSRLSQKSSRIVGSRRFLFCPGPEPSIVGGAVAGKKIP